MMESTPEQNKATVLEAFDTLFNKRDYAAAERFWSDRYIQHSAHIAPGRGGLFALGRALPATLRHRPSRPVPRPPVRAAPGLARLAGRPRALRMYKGESSSRLNHRLPWGETDPKIMQRTADFHDQIAHAHLPQAVRLVHNATALHAAVDVLDADAPTGDAPIGRFLRAREGPAARLLGRHDHLDLR
jgi:hypothetical protein